MFISIQRYDVAWLVRPFVLVMFALAALSLLRPVLQDIRAHHGLKTMLSSFGRPRLTADNLFPAALLGLFVVMLAMSASWPGAARIVPTIVAVGAIISCGLSLANDILGVAPQPGEGGLAAQAQAAVSQKIHMDIGSTTGHLPGGTILIRGFQFFGWMVAFLGCMALIGLIPTVPIFVVAYMRLEGPEKWRHALTMAAAMTALIYVVFDQLLHVPWPTTVLGTWFPVLKVIPST
jgi:hypothetical protein